MQTTSDKSFNALVEQFLGIRLPQQMAAAIPLPELPPDTRNFIMRMLPLMKRAGYSATGFNPPFIRWLSTIGSVLPNAWGGRIPPLTLPGRHKKLDTYVADQNREPGKEPHIFLDIGCGFPPVTAADTALRLSDWQVFGVDRSFADYVLYNSNGHYACFDQDGVFQYFQALMSSSGRDLYADPDGTSKQFIKLFEELFPLLENPSGITSETVEKDGNRLIHNHIRDFETENLTFIKSDIGELNNIRSAQVIRCMNVLIYFNTETRKKMLLQAGELLDDNGILIAGTNGFGIQFRYTVYKKGTNGIFPSEFAFGLDNLGHIVFMPWFTIHENDPEAILLADLAGAIRADQSFWPDFSKRMDELLQIGGICRRSGEFLDFFRKEMPPSEFIEKNARLWQQMDEEGYSDSAVDALGRAGYDAWKNPVGDIAIRPSANSLP